MFKKGDLAYTPAGEETVVSHQIASNVWYYTPDGGLATCDSDDMRVRIEEFKPTSSIKPQLAPLYRAATEPCCTKEAILGIVNDVVANPAHYQFFPDVEAIEIIASSMTVEGFAGYCMGNRLKYRLRAGNKDKLEQDISKSDFYLVLFEKHKHLCKFPQAI
ncbi:MAG: hypothetical protein [Caudoviricetes sp.]|nr:MAG: hypothetical protein [Caudoviricetes sp.]